MRIIILAALAEEADAVFAGQGQHGNAGWAPVRAIERPGHQLAIVTTGIGKVNTAAAAALMIERHAPDLLLEVGTAGRIGPAAGDCFWLASAIQHDYGAEQPGQFVHYDPGAWPIGPGSVSAYVAMDDPGTGLPHARIASGDAFIACPDHARFLSEGLAADLVDMETAALAQVAERAGLPWAGIKAVTDDANEGSAGDFHANLLAASQRAASALERLIGLI